MPVHSLKDLKQDDAGHGDPHDGPVDGEKLPTDFMGIYHEKQIGSLCAVHAINNLLQGPAMDEVALAELAHGLDAQERQALGGLGFDADTDASGGSANVRADGFFSSQVISLALQHLGLTCTPIGAESVRGARDLPAAETGFILHRSQHWFALRKLGGHWLELNSTSPRPRALTDGDLAETLAQATASGYSVFVVRGSYPPAPIEASPARLRAALDSCKAQAGGAGTAIGAVAAPRVEAFSGAGHTLSGAPQWPVAAPEVERLAREDPELAAALVASMGDAPPEHRAAAPVQSAEQRAEEMRRKRLARFG